METSGCSATGSRLIDPRALGGVLESGQRGHGAKRIAAQARTGVRGLVRPGVRAADVAQRDRGSAYVCDIGNRLRGTDAEGWLLADQASQRTPVFAGIRIVKVEQVVI